MKNGGDDRNRTCDILNANQVLYQLSYIPISIRRVRGILLIIFAKSSGKCEIFTLVNQLANFSDGRFQLSTHLVHMFLQGVISAIQMFYLLPKLVALCF